MYVGRNGICTYVGIIVSQYRDDYKSPPKVDKSRMTHLTHIVYHA